MRPSSLPRVGPAELVARYDFVLLDAFGVLVNGTSALAYAPALLGEIRDQGKDFLVVTNDASRLPETAAERFARLGLEIEANRILTAGSLLRGYFAERGLSGARCMVLGTRDSEVYVREAGGVVVPIESQAACDVLAVCDDDGYQPFLECVEDALSMLYWHFDRGKEVTLVLPNPDLIYPKREGAYGFTSGMVALMLEAGLERRYPGRNLRFDRLGKPHTPIFEEARRRAQGRSMVMIGDQIETDIAGANAANIDSALVSEGVSRWDELANVATPTYLLELR